MLAAGTVTNPVLAVLGVRLKDEQPTLSAATGRGLGV